MADFEANFTLEQQPTIEADFSMTVINTDHDALTNRDKPDQHPISAITGLQNALDGITSDVVTEQELSDALATKQDTLTAGTGISIENGVISSTQTSAEWGNIGGTLSDQTDLQNALNTKQDIISDLTDIRNGAALGSTALQPNDNITELNNNAGFITGITSSDVTTALGYTPYNSSNPSNYQTATQVANSIATETTNRENADNNLQSQIDAIVSSSDVFDIVGTYAELQAYDITTVPVNDIIKVLVDSTHSGAATYYRCVETGGVKSWSYIGSEGAYYTKAEADAAFVPQTRTVNNKALSANISLTAADVGADVSGAASTAETNAKNYADGLAINYATAAQGALADTAVQPSSLATVATSGSYNDLSNKPTIPAAQVNSDWNASSGVAEILNKPTIPTVNDVTINFTQGGVNKGSFTLNQATGTTIALDAGGSAPTNMVTTDTDQDISGIKTFVGEKRIKFKQSASGNKLGFTLYDNTGKEAAAFEYKPNAINSYPLLYLGQYKGNGTSYISTPIYVGFRSYDWDKLASYNLVAPLAKDAKSSFSLNGLYKTFYLPLGVTDGNTTVTTGSNGVLDISSLLSGGGGSYTAGTGIDITNDTISVDSTVATTNTAQTITGTKTFEGDSWITKIKNNTVTYNYAPASDVWTSIAFVDANDMQMGTVDCWRQPDNSTVMQLNVFGSGGYWGSNLGQSLQFGVDSNNQAFALAPNPRANPNTNEIATVGWINGSSSDVVHKSNTETITGTKTFEGNQWVTKFKNTTVAYNVAPVSGDVSTSIAFVDNNDNAMGTVDCWRYRDNSTEMDFGIFAANGAWISSTLKIYADANGNASAHAPTPAVGSNGDDIATTEWVNTTISGKQNVSNLVTSVSSASTDSQYPSAKLFYDTCGDIETLINAL